MGKRKSVDEFLRYAFVGVSGLIVNVFFLWILTEFAGTYYLLSGVISFSIATLSNFFWNKIWTFRENVLDRFFQKGAKFFFVAGCALFVNLFFLWLFTDVFGIYYLISQILAAAFTLVVNFVGNKFWTFC